jgi:hypothetical protein
MEALTYDDVMNRPGLGLERGKPGFLKDWHESLPKPLQVLLRVPYIDDAPTRNLKLREAYAAARSARFDRRRRPTKVVAKKNVSN